jgi:glycyl-tRNA synthetase
MSSNAPKKASTKAKTDNAVMEEIVSLAKRRGFIFQGSEIYGGLAGTWDYGPLGVALKKNVEGLWWRHFVEEREDMYGLDSAILMNPRVWEASGHVAGFSDPLVEDVKTKKRYRADHLLEDAGVNPSGMSLSEMGEVLKKQGIKSPDGNALSTPQQFNMMFRTTVGSVEGGDMTVYMRPETAQGMFVDFKNVLDAYHPRLPFGIAQIGRAFRNEIAPRDFIFRVRELEIMEFEYFIREAEWQTQFEYWRQDMQRWFARLGFAPDDIKEIEVPDAERAHYSKRTMDFYFKYPFGYKEIGGLAYRTDFDLSNHVKHSGADLRFTDPNTTEKFIPHVLEPTFGLGRHVLAVLAKAYTVDEIDGEKRIVLRFPPRLAPIKVAVFPLLKNKPDLVARARDIFMMVKKAIPQAVFDDNGNIGKRYRRQDEIGTPLCVTVDFETLEGAPTMGGAKDTVTLRSRDTGEQRRVLVDELVAEIKKVLNS